MIQIDDRRFNQLALIGLAIGFALLVAAFLAAVSVFNANETSKERVRHTYDVVAQLSLLEIQLERAEAGRRGYLLSHSPYRLEVYRQNMGLVPQTLARLKLLVRDNPRQVARAKDVERIEAAQIGELRQSIALAMSGRTDEAIRQFRAKDQTSGIRQLRATTAAMRDEERRLLEGRSATEQRSLRTAQSILMLTGLLMLAVGAAAFWLVRRYTTDLSRARDRLHLLNTDLEGAVAERTADLQRANEEIQRFAYIVSHDLRSPLVNILGFTAELEQTNKSLSELITRAETEAPQIVTDETRAATNELPEAIGFIRSSTQKMDRLINAILKLSREGRRNLAPERLPMATVLTEINRSLEHRAMETGTRITIEEPIPDLVSDRVAIEQIFSNLIENAIKYLDPKRPGRVAIRGAENAGRAIYEVEDNGRGIDPKDHERIFDLFRRSGRQDQPGEGIGLAHVRALAYRLGGTIDVDSALGEGTTFRLNLPTTYSG